MKKATRFLKDLNDILPLSLCIIITIVLSITFMFLDLLNPVTMLISRHGLKVTVLILVAIISIIIILLLKFCRCFCNDMVNAVDSVCIISILTFLFYMVIICLIGISSTYKVIVSGVCAVSLALTEIIRAIRYSKPIKNYDDVSFVSLKDIYEDNIKINNGKMILVDETAVDYDLLDRGFSINYLYNSIVTYNVNSSHVIGLEGEWGSGKTTLINNVKLMIKRNNENVKIIDDFDPWSCGSEEALFSSLCEAIDKTIKLRYGFVSNKKLLKQISSIVTQNYITGGIISAVYERFYGTSSFDQLTKLKNE
ncbi:MAG: hypothetical protein HFE30_01145 [Clostridiales bacterium]|nr:hypothetical protein [Clostridiales bacterium]